MKTAGRRLRCRAILLTELMLYLLLFSLFCGMAVSLFHSQMKVQRHIAQHDERRAAIDMILRWMRRDFVTASSVELSTAPAAASESIKPVANPLADLIPPPELSSLSSSDRVLRAIATVSLSDSNGSIVYALWEDAPRDPYPQNTTLPAPPATHTLVRTDEHGESYIYSLCGELLNLDQSIAAPQPSRALQIRFASPVRIGDGAALPRRFETTLCVGGLP